MTNTIKFNEVRLAKCQFCGGGVRIHTHAEIAKVECPKCGRTTGWMSPASEAVDYWNYMNKKEN